MTRTLFIAIVMIVLLTAGCSDSFDPNGTYQQRLVVYGIIDGNSSTQYIRVRSTFAPDLYDPLKASPNTEVTNAVVTVKEGTKTYLFRDTVIMVTSSGTTSPKHVYVATNFLPVGEKTYTLTVSAPGFDTVRSSLQSIAQAYVQSDGTILSKPSLDKKTIPISFQLGKNAIAYMPMILFEYRLDMDTTLRYKEVPLSVMRDAGGNITKKFFPVPTFQENAAYYTNVYQTMTFSIEAYLATIDELKTENVSHLLTVTRVIVRFVQFDDNLYTYYSIANVYGGGSTIRLDEPDYSAITNGFGTFGMMMKVDRTYIPPQF